MEGTQNGLEQKVKPPIMPKPSRFKTGNSSQTEAFRSDSPNAARLQIHPSPQPGRSSSNDSLSCSLNSPATGLVINPATSADPNNSADSGHRTAVITTAGGTVKIPSCYSTITLVSSSPVPQSPVENSTGHEQRISFSATSGRRTSFPAASSEPPSSPIGFFRENSSTSIGQHHSPSPSSLHSGEEDSNNLATSSLSQVYPSPSHSTDSKTILVSPPSVRDLGSDSISLQELVDKYSQSFPLQIKVVHGYIGQTSQLTLASGDYYNIHFVKHQEVVSMTDKLGLHYTIPLNSSFQFGLVYSEDPNIRESQIYENVAHVVSLSPLPKVVCPTRDVGGSDDKNAISAGEILVIKRVIRPKLRKKSLEVLSLKTQTIKTLSLDCEGHFSLSPKMNQIYLLELVKCVPDVFPCKAKMFLGSDAASSTHKTSHSLLHATITLTGQKTETSLIASPVTFPSLEDQDGELGAQVNEHLMDIPVDNRLSGVAVSVVDTSECRLQEMLNLRTRTLFETFDVTRVKSWYNPMKDDTTQSLLYATIGRGSEGLGIRVDKPMAAFTRYTPFFSGDTTEKPEVLYETVYSPSMRRRQSSGHHPGHRNLLPAQYEQPNIYRTSSITSSSETVPLPHSIPPQNMSDSTAAHSPLLSVPKPIDGRRMLQRSKSHYTLPPSDLLMTDCYEDMQPAITPSRPPPLSWLQNIDSKLEQLMTTTTSLQTQLNQLTHQVSAMQDQLKDVTEMTVVVKKDLEGMSALSQQTSQLHGARGIRSGRSSVVLTPTSRREAQIQQNRLYLDTLDTAQVCMRDNHYYILQYCYCVL